MARFKIPKIIRDLNLSDHAPEYEKAVIQVWVNPPRGKMADFNDIRSDFKTAYDEISEVASSKESKKKTAILKNAGDRLTEANQRLYEWWALIWSQGSDPENHWTAKEIKNFQALCSEEDPELWVFVQREAFQLILDYRGEGKKKLNPRS